LARQLRPTRRGPHPPRAPRLARLAVRRIGLVAQGAAPPDRELGHLPHEHAARPRRRRRRLDAEEVRDAVLAVSGGLNRAMGGTRLGVQNHAYVNSTVTLTRRGIYD